MPQRKLYLGPLTDNRRWDHLTLRPDDIIVVTPPKSGTTWMQTIIALLLSGDPEVETELMVKMPWVDIRLRDMAPIADHLEAMPHRRSMKSHTPLDGLPLHPQAQYICVFRHPLDTHFSMRRHMQNMPISWFDHWFPQDDPDTTFRRFLDGGAEGFDGDAAPLAHILRHFHCAKAMAERPNVTLFHYADMTRDLPATFDKLANLLGTPHPHALMQRLIQTASFDHMKSNAARFAPSGGKGMMRSDSDFFHSGSSGKWQGKLTADQLSAYDSIMQAALTEDERAWLEYGNTKTPA
ncbi:sulfotransferase domain-containing protein [Alphaproteobacteria bacterium KMM 3653]|uniref:Sulfotransferase domain-containing protein n=1 Tax=Harenicola maris TaxID=2841044 RepID=A0AAP2G326_9RHOB|nr:sulfotransferase domain-containing protein [Harenicola maris]